MNNDKLQKYIEKARDYQNRGDHEKAIVYYSKCIFSDAYGYEAILGVATCLTFLDCIKEAIDTYLYLAIKHPDKSNNYFVLKNKIRTLALKNDNYDLCRYAIKMFEQMAEHLESDIEVSDALSDFYWSNQQEEKSLLRRSQAANSYAITTKNISNKLDGYQTTKKGSRSPNFIVIGPQKSGTTALYSYLVEHPQVYPAIQKEIFYFDTQLYKNGLDWYRSHFPDIAGECYITGEATARYFNSPVAAMRMSKDLPDTKIIFILRDPADRAISDYYMKVRNGVEKRSIDRALLPEVDFLDSRSENIDFVRPGKEYYQQHKGYVLNGLYYFFLKQYLDCLKPEQYLIFDSYNLRKNRASVVDEALNFLGIKTYSHLAEEANDVNVGQYSKKSKVYLDVRNSLSHFYQKYNLMLEELTGMELVCK